MEARELRIGNYVQFNSQLQGWIVDRVHKDYFDEGNLSNVKEIPLSEEWLRRFGFEQSYDSLEDISTRVFVKKVFSIYLPEGLGFVLYWNKNKRRYIVYVHELQNLYFALMGVELVVEDEKDEIVFENGGTLEARKDGGAYGLNTDYFVPMVGEGGISREYVFPVMKGDAERSAEFLLKCMNRDSTMKGDKGGGALGSEEVREEIKKQIDECLGDIERPIKKDVDDALVALATGGEKSSLLRKENLIAYRVSLHKCNDPQKLYNDIIPLGCGVSERFWIPQTMADQIWMWFFTDEESRAIELDLVEREGKKCGDVYLKDMFMHDGVTQEDIDRWCK